MKLPLILLTLLLISCVTVEEVTTVTNSTPIITEEFIPPITEPVNELTACKPSSLIVEGAANDREIGLVDLVIENRSTYYKVTQATIYVSAEQWYLNDITLEFTRPGSALMQFYRQQVPIAPEAKCVILDIPLSISIKDISEPYVLTLQLGQGQNRAGQRLISAETTIDLQDYVS